MMSTGMVDRVMGFLGDAGVQTEIFSNVVADPPASMIREAVATAANLEVTGVIGIGGGSSLDTAKLVALLAPGRETLRGRFRRRQR